jgi:DNA-binding NtrC family response regulator
VRILVVEDDPLIREIVVEALREEGYDVIHASNGEEAMAWCWRRGRRRAGHRHQAARSDGRVADRRTMSRA